MKEATGAVVTMLVAQPLPTVSFAGSVTDAALTKGELKENDTVDEPVRHVRVPVTVIGTGYGTPVMIGTDDGLKVMTTGMFARTRSESELPTEKIFAPRTTVAVRSAAFVATTPDRAICTAVVPGGNTAVEAMDSEPLGPA